MLLSMIYIMGVMSIGCITWGIISNFDEIFDYIKNKKERMQKMNEIRKKSGISIYSIVKLCSVSVYTICKTKLIMTIQTYMDGLNITCVDRDIYDIKLFIKGKYVKIRVKLNRGPSDILYAMNNDLKDVTEELVPYYNYKLVNITPKMMNTDVIEIIKCDGDNKVYKDEEGILN